MADADLWGHVRFGQDLLAAGRLPQTDAYSYLSAGQPWINHEWLAEVLFALAFNLAGPPGLIVLKTALSLLLLGLVLGQLMRSGLDVLLSGVVLLLASLLCLPGLNTVRPQLFSYLGVLAVLLLLRQAEAGRVRLLWGLPVVFALWANLHGGFLAGLAIMLTWSVVELGSLLLRERRVSALMERVPRTILGATLASIVAILANPYGIGLPLFLLRTATVPRPEIAEWVPLPLLSQEGLIYLMLLAIALFGLLGSRRPRSAARMAVLLGLAIAPLTAIRHLPLFAVGVAVLTGDHLVDAVERWLPGCASASRLLPARLWSLSLAFGVAGALLLAALPHFRCVRLERTTGFDFPVRAVALMKEAGVRGNLAVHFDWGEYVLWHLAPQIRVSVDGRRETLYADDVYEENVRLRLGGEGWDAVLDRPQTDLALVSKRYPGFALLRARSGWELAYEDSVCALFVRTGSPWLGPLRRATAPNLPDDGDGLCFP